MACAGSAPLITEFTPTLDCVTHKAQADDALPAPRGVMHCSLCVAVAPPAPELPLTQQVTRVARAKPAAALTAFVLVQPMVRPPARAPPLFS